MFVISRFMEGICINPKEYIVDEHQNVVEFETSEQAVQYLTTLTGETLTLEEYDSQGIYIDEVEQ